jgi:hypothetical protein
MPTNRASWSGGYGSISSEILFCALCSNTLCFALGASIFQGEAQHVSKIARVAAD